MATWSLGHSSVFDVVDFLICEIEDVVFDGLRARRQLPYAHILRHIFSQLIRFPQFQEALRATCVSFGVYKPQMEDVLRPSTHRDNTPTVLEGN